MSDTTPKTVTYPRFERDRDDRLREEALSQAVRFATGPSSSGNTSSVVDAAKKFYAFLASKEAE